MLSVGTSFSFLSFVVAVAVVVVVVVFAVVFTTTAAVPRTCNCLRLTRQSCLSVLPYRSHTCFFFSLLHFVFFSLKNLHFLFYFSCFRPFSAAYEDKETIRLFKEGNKLREKEKHRPLERGRGQSSASFFADMQAAADSDDSDKGEDKD